MCCVLKKKVFSSILRLGVGRLYDMKKLKASLQGVPRSLDRKIGLDLLNTHLNRQFSHRRHYAKALFEFDI